MAYGTPQTSGRRVVALAGVGAVHGVLAVALLTGFAGGIIKIQDKDWLPSLDYTTPPPPPPAPVPPVKPTAQKHDLQPMPEPQVPLPPLGDPGFKIDTGPLPPVGSGFGGDVLPPLPTASPSPRFTPRAAAPLGMPGRWVSDSDYPAAALHRGEQGAAGFEVTIGPDGRVRDCRITRSSGSASLDAATCAKVSERAQFTPARDENGDPVTGRYANVIRWRIPE